MLGKVVVVIGIQRICRNRLRLHCRSFGGEHAIAARVLRRIAAVVRPRDLCADGFAGDTAGAGWALGITMDVAVSQDRDWVKWGGASTSPKVNGDENQGIWVAYKAIKDNLLRRVNQFDTVEIPNSFQ